MKDFIIANWFSILLIGIFVCYTVYLLCTKQWNKLRRLGYALILEAEKGIKGSKKGQDKFDYVLTQLFFRIPGWLLFFVSEQSMKEKLQEWFDDIKDYLDNGKIDKSI